MKRSKFLASLAAMAVAPFVRTDSPVKELPPPMPKFDRMATVDKYIIGVDPYKEFSSPAEILNIYHETGVLVWKKEPDGEVVWKPIEVIDDGKV